MPCFVTVLLLCCDQLFAIKDPIPRFAHPLSIIVSPAHRVAGFAGVNPSCVVAKAVLQCDTVFLDESLVHRKASVERQSSTLARALTDYLEPPSSLM